MYYTLISDSTSFKTPRKMTTILNYCKIKLLFLLLYKPIALLCTNTDRYRHFFLIHRYEIGTKKSENTLHSDEKALLFVLLRFIFSEIRTIMTIATSKACAVQRASRPNVCAGNARKDLFISDTMSLFRNSPLILSRHEKGRPTCRRCFFQRAN